MNIYRISSSQYVEDLSGAGGLFASGRWHKKGTRLVYFSETVALAKLEKLANSPTGVPKSQKLLVLSLPDTLKTEILEWRHLDNKWSSIPPSLTNYELVSEWLEKSTSLLLKVPSIHSPFEYNFLMNPDHPDIKLTSKQILNLEFDSRIK
ncbi:MAG: RES family NAD+ phosphorylase [Bacteroidota bacterium]